MRTAVVAASLAELTEQLREVAEGDTPYTPAVGQDDRGPVWVFSGQGSQWAAMGAALLASEPVFAARVAEIEPLVAREAGFSVTAAMTASETVTGIDRIQPVLFTMQVALAAAMASYGVRPGAVIGHSLGEVSAAVFAGALSLEDGVRVICRRSWLCARLAGGGAMAAVELPAQRVREELTARGVTDVVVSVLASPQSTVIGGTTETVRELVAAWEQRGLMAREVAVDVASHSPQVDPILAELADVLAELNPTTATVPFYSATLQDPRAQPAFDAGYWVDNLRHPVRFATAVQAALDDGYRVFGELAPHPLLTRAVEQTAAAADASAQALAALRREQELPHGLRDFLADLHCAGAAVDFSVLCPNGRLVDAPLPTWTHRRLLVGSDGQGRQAQGARTVVVHPLLGEHVRLPEEPERHAWQGEVGTGALPWLSDHQVHAVPAFPGAAYCEMALSAARTVLGEKTEIRDIRFEQMLLLDEQTPVTAVATVDAPGVVDFVVETDQDGERARRAVALLHAAADEQQPPRVDVPAVLAAHPTRVDGSLVRQWFDNRGVQFGPAFTGLVAAYTAPGKARTVLGEVALPGPVRSQQAAYGVHPALLDACFQSVAAHPALLNAAVGGLLLPLEVRRLRSHGPARDARYCFARLTASDATGVEADVDALDEDGTVLLSVRGLRMGSATKTSARDHLLAERLLTIEWQPRTLPEPPGTDAGAWVLVSTAGADDHLATELATALKSLGAQCLTLAWPQDADQLRPDGVTGLVVLTPPSGDPDDRCPVRGAEHVRQLVRIARELPDLSGVPPRLYVVTRSAQGVLAGDPANLDQAGLRGLLRVIGAEHPHLRPTQIDLDSGSDPGQLAAELLAGTDEDETAWRGGQWYTARLRPSPLRPDERRTATVDHQRDGAAPSDPHSG